MKNKFHAFLYITATVLLLLNISSCSGIASPSEQESPSASRGLSLRGRFSLAEASAVPSEYQTATNASQQASRNAIPDTSTLTYSVSATNASNGNIVWATNANSTSYEFNGNLTAGTWEITAYAKQGTAVVLQSEPKTVTLSKLAMDASESLTMAPSTSGSGSIDLTVNWASDSGIGYCNYSKPDGITITTTSGQPDRITAESIAPGIYTVTLTFYTSEDNYNSGAAPLYKCTEYIAVYPGLETDTWTDSTAPHLDASGSFNVTKSCVETFVYRKIYVEQGASSSNANGTSERPYPSIESAMTRLSEVAGAGIITGISATNPWELHVKGTLKAPSGIGQDFINVPSSVGHLAIIGEGSGATIDADSKCRVLNVASGANVTVQNITLKNGSATTGGGVYVANGGTFTMQSGTISSCYASGAGGGIYSEGTLSIQGGYINSNNVTAVAGTGGGIQVAGGSVSVAATGVTIKSNSCGGNGKNIYISSSATATIPTGDNAIYDDSTGTGGKADAICYASGNNFARFNKAHSTQNAIDSVISQFTGDATIYLGMTTSGDTSWNSTTDIASACTQNLTIRPTKTGTKATIKYSASAETTDYLIRFNQSGKTLTLTNLILDGNSKKCGVAKLEAGTLTATNCTFQYGKSEKGGGIYVNISCTANLTSCTVKGCHAEKNSSANCGCGGGIYTKGTVNFSGTIEACSVKGIGGGVFVETTANAKFNMTSGTIKNCRAEEETSTTAWTGRGGGAWSYQTFNMTGGTITGCSSEKDGAGIFLASADSSTPVLIMSGNACVDSNNDVYVGTYKIKIADSLTASKAATITPYSYSGTPQVLTDDSSGSLVNANYTKFDVVSETHMINSSGQITSLTAQEVSTLDELKTCLSNITGSKAKIKLTSNITVDTNTLSGPMLTIPAGKSISLVTDGSYTIKLDNTTSWTNTSTNFTLVKVGTGAKLTLGNGITLQGVNYNNAHTYAVYIENGGEVTIESGATITGFDGNSSGTVYVGSNAKFTMNGGTISNCEARYGSAVYNYGTFNFYGGSITGCSNVNGKTIDGGGTMNWKTSSATMSPRSIGSNVRVNEI